MTANEDMLGHYSHALDEIYRLRVALAYEAHVATSLLTYATLPSGARAQLEDMVDRARAAARGEVAYRRLIDDELRGRILRNAGASETLTRHQWETS